MLMLIVMITILSFGFYLGLSYVAWGMTNNKLVLKEPWKQRLPSRVFEVLYSFLSRWL